MANPDPTAKLTVPDTTTEGAAPATTDPNGPPEGVKSYAGLSQEHTEDPVSYPQNPPVGGKHNPQWQTCGYYSEPIQTEKGVHSMEHGAVWITYQTSLPADQIALLSTMADGHDHLLISPFFGLPTPVVASAWGEQLQLDSATDPRLAQFIEYYEEGPQTPEPGVRC